MSKSGKYALLGMTSAALVSHAVMLALLHASVALSLSLLRTGGDSSGALPAGGREESHAPRSGEGAGQNQGQERQGEGLRAGCKAR